MKGDNLILVIGIFLLNLFLIPVHSQSVNESLPNILFIVSEDNGPELSCYGAPVPTPHLDELAKNGVLFLNAYVPQAGCSPSRAAFLTGLYPHQNGQVGLATWKYHMYDKDAPNMINTLKEGGYRTGMLGKLHVNPEKAFDLDYWEIPDANFKRKDLSRYADLAGQFLRSSEKPFFLQVNYPDAHRPFMDQIEGLPTEPLNGKDVEILPYMGLDNAQLREETAGYYNSIMRLDHLIGDLLEELKASGKYNNTLIVYIGDHGGDILRGKRTCYEGGLKIPMIISFPGAMRTNHVSNDLVSSLDLFPTFLETAEMKTPKHLPGQSLWPILSGKGSFKRKFLFSEYHVHSNHNPYPQRAVRNRQYKLIHNLLHDKENPRYEFTIDHFHFNDIDETIQSSPIYIQEAYRRMKHPPEYELYDLHADPFEWNNLAVDIRYKKTLNKLIRKLKDWQQKTNDPFIDKSVAERFFQDVTNTEEQKVDIPYSLYMDMSNIKTKK
ncbi:sulfatase family protein [Membranihabitans marinus]|uniref:sulfatase family protein n=1 Tax=Membranihabitans marinus TaxID=1227546 RepID=UPI001F16FB6D|nr:sulfatase [Membranihabitans marinus]